MAAAPMIDAARPDRRPAVTPWATVGLAIAAGIVGAFQVGKAAMALPALRADLGIGFLMVVVGVPSLITRLTRPSDLKLALGAWGAYMPVGQAIMILAAPPLLSPFGWRGLWIANAMLLVIFAAVLARATAALPNQTMRPALSLRGDLRDTATAPGPLLLAAIFGCHAMQYLAVMGFLPTILIEREGLGFATTGGLAAVAVAMNGLGNLAGGVLFQRGAPRWLLVAAAGCAMGSAALAIFAASPPLWASYALYLVFSGMGGLLPASVFGAVPLHAPNRLVATTNGLVVQGSNLGQVIGPLTVGALAGAMGWSWTPLVIALAAVSVGLLALVLRRREHGRA